MSNQQALLDDIEKSTELAHDAFKFADKNKLPLLKQRAKL